MTSPAQTRLVRYSPVELVDAVRSGRIRYREPWHPPSVAVARTVDGLRRGLPVRPLLLWQDRSDGTLWVLDGGEVLDDLLAAAGVTERQASNEPLQVDTNTGEVVPWSLWPGEDHDVVDLPALLGADDVEAHLSEQRVVGERADRVRSLVVALRRRTVVAQITDLPQADLPAVVRRLPSRRGISLDRIDAVIGPEPGPKPEWYAWTPDPRALVSWAKVGEIEYSTPDEAVWRLLVVAEGGDPATAYDPSATSAGFVREGRDAVQVVREAALVLRGWFFLGGGRLLPGLDLLAALARFLRVFPTIEEPVLPLVRRWLWRAALTEHELDLSQEALSVIRHDAADSALRLLAATPVPELRHPSREPIDVESRRGRMVLHGLASLRPRDLMTGERVDVEETRVRPIFRDRPLEPANVFLHDHVFGSGIRHDIDAIVRAHDVGLLASHGIDPPAVRLLRDRLDEAFLARRAAVLNRAVVDHWTRGTQPDAASRRPVTMLFEDDHAE